MKKYEPNAQVAYREVEGELLMIHPVSGEIFVLNETGKIIWQTLQHKATLHDIIRSIAVGYFPINIPSYQATYNPGMLFCSNLSARMAIGDDCCIVKSNQATDKKRILCDTNTYIFYAKIVNLPIFCIAKQTKMVVAHPSIMDC